MDIIATLLQYYSFDLGDRNIDELLTEWSKYDQTWVRLAIVECLHQGRYKGISVSQILTFWQRKGEPQCRFNHEFERLVCGDFRFTSASVPRKVTQTTFQSPAQSPAQANPKTSQKNSSQSSAQSKQQPSHKSSIAPPKSDLNSLPKLPAKVVVPAPTNYKSVVQTKLLADQSLFVDKLRAICQTSNPHLAINRDSLSGLMSDVSTKAPASL